MDDADHEKESIYMYVWHIIKKLLGVGTTKLPVAIYNFVEATRCMPVVTGNHDQIDVTISSFTERVQKSMT